jgi:molybdate transport system ATP-binding protein
MSRPDLSWLREAVGLGSLFEAVVTHTHPSRGLIELTFAGGTLFASDSSAVPGSKVRLRIPAREVILATSEPQGLSLHNALSGTVSAIHVDPAFEHVIVQVAVGEVLLLAEITRDAIATLGIAVGMRVYALIKSVSIDMLKTEATQAQEAR